MPLTSDAPVEPVPPKLSICLINPRFEPSYWGFDYALPLYPGDKRSSMISGSLPTVAGMCEPHDVALVDENVEDVDWSSLQQYDIVGVTGMTVQQERIAEILFRLRDIDVLTVVGGPLVSVNETFFEGRCDVRFIGEAETTWPAFLNDVALGKPYQKRYEQSEPTDMAHAPRPRYDLLKVDRYATGAVQYSRGCPFRCEFCDIIVIYGRVPRVKESDQLLQELDDMRRAGFFSAFIVDDNFIGNKKKAKELLRKVIPWQEAHGYPLRLTTEASVNLADDAELLELMYRANFRSVFIGIETPRTESLLETKKVQNTRGDSLDEKLTRIQNAGLDINAGFIVGFDSDDDTIFDDQYEFIQRNGIPLAMVGMLTAIPRTPLYERLEAAGRLAEDDPNCNFIPEQMTREELRDGYWELVRRLYTPEAFFDRYFKAFHQPEYLRKRTEICDRAGEGKALPTFAYGVAMLASLSLALFRDRSLKSVGGAYLKQFVTRSLRYRCDIIGFAQFMNRCVTHWHFYKFTREAIAGRLRTYNSG